MHNPQWNANTSRSPTPVHSFCEGVSNFAASAITPRDGSASGANFFSWGDQTSIPPARARTAAHARALSNSPVQQVFHKQLSITSLSGQPRLVVTRTRTCTARACACVREKKKIRLSTHAHNRGYNRVFKTPRQNRARAVRSGPTDTSTPTPTHPWPLLGPPEPPPSRYLADGEPTALARRGEGENVVKLKTSGREITSRRFLRCASGAAAGGARRRPCRRVPDARSGARKKPRFRPKERHHGGPLAADSIFGLVDIQLLPRQIPYLHQGLPLARFGSCPRPDWRESHASRVLIGRRGTVFYSLIFNNEHTNSFFHSQMCNYPPEDGRRLMIRGDNVRMDLWICFIV